MSTPVYPASLPSLDRLSHLDINLGSNVRRTAMSTGPQKVRRVSTATPDPIAMGHRAFTQTQRNTFITFFKTTLSDGALAFEMADPLGGTSEFRFLQPPNIKPSGGDKWAISVRLERMP